MCFIFHKWSKWSEPTKHQVVYPSVSREMFFTEMRQSRTCGRCGKHEVRMVDP